MRKEVNVLITSKKELIHKLVDAHLENFRSEESQRILNILKVDTEKVWLSSIVSSVGDNILKGTSLCSSKRFVSPLAYILYTKEEIELRYRFYKKMESEIYSYLNAKDGIRLKHNHGMSFVDLSNKKLGFFEQLFY